MARLCRLGLRVATGGELDARLRWSGYTQMGTFQGNMSQKNMFSERPLGSNDH